MDQVPPDLTLFYRFGAALAIGFLVGLQREYAYTRGEAHRGELFAGTRTFALLALLGGAAAALAQWMTAPLVFVAFVAAAGALIGAAYVLLAREGDRGLTTEVAALLTLAAGALCFAGRVSLAAALGVATTVLLSLKVQTQSLARVLTSDDVYATLKFAVISVVVLPLLPRESPLPPPFDVLVPRDIWLMVVFISGISFLGYVLIGVVGARRGVGLTGLLGGLASSTAVTLSFSQRSRDASHLAPAFALAILLAWTIMFVRVMVAVAAINPALMTRLWLPLSAVAAVNLAYCAYLYLRRGEAEGPGAASFRNPFELGPALKFGLLYVAILLLAHVAQQRLGQTGIYLSSLVSGLADVDAITLSMARLSRAGGSVEAATAARAIVLAAVSNTVVKGGIVLSVGAPALRRAILPGLVLSVTAAIGAAFLL